MLHWLDSFILSSFQIRVTYILHSCESRNPWIPAFAGMRGRAKLFRITIFLFLILVSIPVPAFADDLKIVTVTGQTVSFHVDIANTPETRETGLMNRDVMAADAGMLFVFDGLVMPQFWMKDTRIALDMVFIGADGVVKGVYDTAKPYDLTPIPSPAPVLAVLEINGGRAKTLGI